MGNSKSHILVADNDPDSLAAVRFNMKMAGYEVFTATNPVQAKDVLDKQIIHLAIIDMRLTSDKEIEHSGFDVAAHIPSYIPFIIYTAFGNDESVRQAVVRAGAKDCLDKKKPGAASELVETIERLRKAYVKVNLNLEIQGEVTCNEIADKIEIVSDKESRASAEDVRQIFQSLFCDANSISISSMFSPQPTVTQAGSVVVLVHPCYTEGRGEAQVVKFSEMSATRQEEENYHHIKPLLGGMRLAVLNGTAYSHEIGGLIYTLIDGRDWEKIQLFSDYFYNNDKDTIAHSLDQFFRQTFGNIFVNAATKTVNINITEDYCSGFHLTPQKLTVAMRELRPAQSSESHLYFEGLEGTFLNPVRWSLIDEEFRKFEVNSRACLCHGDLHGRNILVNSDGHYWLIDFARVAESHAVRDFVELETDLKFNIVKDIDLTALFPFEWALLTPQRFKDEVPEVEFKSESLAKVYKVIAKLRQVAAESLALNGDMREYYEALLFNTLNVLRLKHIAATKKEHALLSASLLCGRLEQWPEWSFAKIGGSPTS